MNMVEVREYVTGFVSAIIAVVIGVNLAAGVLMPALVNITNIPLLSATLVGTIVGAGILLFILKVFI
jgi:uncharacterized membrane protein YeaQ/YmgE (transglycosylase-associated protein family)